MKLLSSLLLLLVAGAPRPAAGQTVVEPSLYAAGGYTSQVNYVGGEGDYYWGAGFHLPLSRSTENDVFSLRLGVSYQEYGEASRFDNWSYDGGLGWSRRLSPRSTFGLDLFARRRDRAETLPIDQAIETLRPRYRDQSIGGGLSYRYELGPRWALGLRTSYTDSEFEELGGEEGEPQTLSRESWGAGIDLRWRLSARDTLGPEYTFRRFSSETQPDRTTHQVGLRWGRTISERLSVELAGGAVNVRGDESDAEGAEQLEKTGSFLRFGLNRQLERLRFGMSASHRLDNQDPFTSDVGYATSVNLFVGQPTIFRIVQWEANVGYGWREDAFLVDTDAETLETVRAGLRLGVPLGRQMAFTLDASWSDRVQPANDLDSLYRVRVAISWFPFGSRRFGPLVRTREDPLEPGIEPW